MKGRRLGPKADIMRVSQKLLGIYSYLPALSNDIW